MFRVQTSNLFPHLKTKNSNHQNKELKTMSTISESQIMSVGCETE